MINFYYACEPINFLETVVVHPPKNFTLHKESDYNVTYSCTTENGPPVWEVACVRSKYCNFGFQLRTPELKRDINRGWIVKDLSDTESVITITHTARLKTGNIMEVFCFVDPSDHINFKQSSSPHYFIYSYGM